MQPLLISSILPKNRAWEVRRGKDGRGRTRRGRKMGVLAWGREGIFSSEGDVEKGGRTWSVGKERG